MAPKPDSSRRCNGQNSLPCPKLAAVLFDTSVAFTAPSLLDPLLGGFGWHSSGCPDLDTRRACAGRQRRGNSPPRPLFLAPSRQAPPILCAADDAPSPAEASVRGERGCSRVNTPPLLSFSCPGEYRIRARGVRSVRFSRVVWYQPLGRLVRSSVRRRRRLRDRRRWLSRAARGGAQAPLCLPLSPPNPRLFPSPKVSRPWPTCEGWILRRYCA